MYALVAVILGLILILMLTCKPNCENKQCGSNGCGGSCGKCAPAYKCSKGGTCVKKNDCGNKQCDPGYECQYGTCVLTNTCAGKSCGTDINGKSCGTCDDNHVCENGDCILKNNCGDQQCGTDNNGNSCGACLKPEVCIQNKCVKPSPPLPPAPTIVAVDAVCASDPDNSRTLVWKVDLTNNFYRNPHVLSFRLIVKDGNNTTFDDFIEPMPYFFPGALEDEYYFQNKSPFPFNPYSSESFLYLYTVFRPFNAQSGNSSTGELYVLPSC